MLVVPLKKYNEQRVQFTYYYTEQFKLEVR